MGLQTAKGIGCDVTTPDEPVLLAESQLPYETVTFSARESLFKALFPQVQHRFGLVSAPQMILSPVPFVCRIGLRRSICHDFQRFANAQPNRYAAITYP